MKHDNSNQNPWAGLSSYEDPAKSELKLKFCGRDNETKEVTRLIDDNFFVTLYGKSGIGKTSLLNAGVFPALRREQYTPLSLRLGMTDEAQTFQDIITIAIERTIEEWGGSVRVVNVVDEQTDRFAIDYLWNWFARRSFLRADGQATFPVIVFDQFEELFRHSESRLKTEVLLTQLHYLIDESHALNDCVMNGEQYYYDFKFRFVLSIREDDLYRLEDSIDNCALSALKRCRYRLRSLSEKSAEAVILVPGEGLFKEEEQKGIVDTIIEIARNKEEKSISTNVLSLICSRIYVDYQRSGDDHITPTLVDSFIKGNPFERFYNEATQGFSNKEKSYIEDNLVDSTGRRNSIPESDFLLHVPNGQQLLEGDTRILQRTSTSSDGNNYRIELIHDSFCKPLAILQEKRRKQRFRKRFMFLLSVFCLILGSGVIISYMLYTNQTLEQSNGLILLSLQITKEQKDSLQKQKDEMALLNKSLNRQIIINEVQKDSLNVQLKVNEKQKKDFEQSLLEQQKLSLSLNEMNRELEIKNKTLIEQKKEIMRMGDSIGSTARFLEKGRPESILSNILTDILVWGGKFYNETPDFAVYNIGSIRASLKEGKTTRGDIINVAPFDNKICFLTIKGDKVFELFEEIARFKGEGVSHGVELTISIDGRLLSAYLNGKEIDFNREYRIATTDFLASTLSAFKDATNMISPQGYENIVRLIFMNYWLEQSAQGKAVDGEIEGRIVVK